MSRRTSLMFTRMLSVVLLLGALSGCRTTNRDLTFDELIDSAPVVLAEIRASRAYVDSITDARLDLKLKAANEAGHPGVVSYDILILSGGGEYGSFGTGVLSGWSDIKDPTLTLPTFDSVSGVSTGALIAPFALAGTKEDIEKVQTLYSEITHDLLSRKAFSALLFGKESLFEIGALQEMISDNITEEIVAGCENAFAEYRQVSVATTDLDFAMARNWDIGYEFSKLNTIEEKTARLTQLLLASSAIPAAFPPVEIDGHLHTDGGATRILFFATSAEEASTLIERLFSNRPDIERVTIRTWVIINKKLLRDPAIISPKWSAVAKRSLSTLRQTSMIDQLEQFRMLTRILNTEFPKVDAVFRYLAIPQDADLVKTTKMFDSGLVAQLIDIGVSVGRDPSNWRTEIPFEVFFERGKAGQKEAEGN